MAFIEAFSDAPGQRGQPLGSRRQIHVGQADFLVPRTVAFSADTAIVVGPLAANLAAQTEGFSLPVTLELGGALTSGADNAGTVVAVFF